MNTLVPHREYLTVREAAARWRVSEKTIRRWIAAGELVALQPAPGHALRIPADELGSWPYRQAQERVGKAAAQHAQARDDLAALEARQHGGKASA